MDVTQSGDIAILYVHGLPLRQIFSPFVLDDTIGGAGSQFEITKKKKNKEKKQFVGDMPSTRAIYYVEHLVLLSF